MTTLESPVGGEISSHGHVGNYYFLPRGVVRIVGGEADGVYTVKITRFNVPDASARYYLRQNHNPFYDDATLLEVDAAGLLATTNVVTEDKTPAIIDKVTETLVNVAKISANLGGSPFGIRSIKQVAKQKLLPFNCTFDPLIPSEVDTARRQMKDCGFSLSVSSADADGKGSTPVAAGKLATSGVYYRPPVTVQIRVTTLGDFDGHMIESSTVRVPDPRHIAVLDLRRPFLVKKTTNLAFVDGDLKKVDYTKPSEALAFVSIPASVTGKIAEALPSIIQVKDSRANAGLQAEKARLDAQKGVLDSQLALRNSQKALEGGASDALAAQSLSASSAPMTVEERLIRARAALQEAKNREAAAIKAAGEQSADPQGAQKPRNGN